MQGGYSCKLHACGLPLMRGSGLRHPEKSGTNRIPNPLRGVEKLRSPAAISWLTNGSDGLLWIAVSRQCFSAFQQVTEIATGAISGRFRRLRVIRRELGQCAPVEDCGS